MGFCWCVGCDGCHCKRQCKPKYPCEAGSPYPIDEVDIPYCPREMFPFRRYNPFDPYSYRRFIGTNEDYEITGTNYDYQVRC